MGMFKEQESYSHAKSQSRKDISAFAPSRLCVIPCCILLFLAGCGSGRFPVAGEVTYDGKPVAEGTISFEPADGKGPTTGGKISGGKYEFKGNAAPLPGKKTVRIYAARKTGRQVEVKHSKPKQLVDEIERYIPDVYNTKTTLTCEVADRETNKINFHLKPK